MARQVGKGYTIHLTAALMAGTKTLEELRSQGHIPTALWSNLQCGPVIDKAPYTGVYRTLIFTLDNGQKVEAKVLSLNRAAHSHNAQKWASRIVWVEQYGRMECMVNHVGNRPWYSQHESDKPLPGMIWRPPTPDEAAAYEAAVRDRNKARFLKVYSCALIAWEAVSSRLNAEDKMWISETLREIP